MKEKGTRSYFLPAALAVLVFVAALAAAINAYTVSGSISLADAALMVAAIALGVCAERIYMLEKDIDALKEAVFEDDEAPGGGDGEDADDKNDEEN